MNIMGAGLSGLAAATILAKAGIEVHVHDIREESGARFDGDFQALENWSMDDDFFDQLKSWGFDISEFKATEFKVVDLIHPDDTITQAQSSKIAYRIVERGTSSHTIDQGIKRQALAAGAKACSFETSGGARDYTGAGGPAVVVAQEGSRRLAAGRPAGSPAMR